MRSKQPTLFLSENLWRMTKEMGVEYCTLHKDKIIQSGKTESEFDDIIKKLQTYYLCVEDLPEMGISDQALKIPHPMDNESTVFTKKQLEKLDRGLHMQWGKFPCSNENCYMTSSCTPDADFEDLIKKGFCTSLAWCRETRGPNPDVMAYFLNEAGLNELKKVWGEFRVSWIPKKTE